VRVRRLLAAGAAPLLDERERAVVELALDVSAELRSSTPA
jgi:hypothetical protein